jgi:hypothetical protein
VHTGVLKPVVEQEDVGMKVLFDSATCDQAIGSDSEMGGSIAENRLRFVSG